MKYFSDMKLVARLAVIAAVALAGVAHAGPKSPETEAPLHRGSELVALRDVSLRSVKISKGSRVVVVQVSFAHGKPSTVHIELKDGHVLRDVPYDHLAESFRPAKS